MPTASELMRRNIRARRVWLGPTQESVATRINQLGYTWYKQTVGLVERDQRPLFADELAALALVLDTTPDVLMLPPPDVPAVLFGEHAIPALRLSAFDDSVRWAGDDIKV